MQNLIRLNMTIVAENAAAELNTRQSTEETIRVGFLPKVSAISPEVKVPTA